MAFIFSPQMSSYQTLSDRHISAIIIVPSLILFKLVMDSDRYCSFTSSCPDFMAKIGNNFSKIFSLRVAIVAFFAKSISKGASSLLRGAIKTFNLLFTSKCKGPHVVDSPELWLFMAILLEPVKAAISFLNLGTYSLV